GAPVSLLLASTWDITGRRTVLVRDRNGVWTDIILVQDAPSPGFLPQIRTFGFHRDRLTGVDHVFASDPAWHFRPNRSRPDRLGEHARTRHQRARRRRLSWAVRPASHLQFRRGRGRLFAAIGQQVWVRQDGPRPNWQRLYT